MLGWLWLALMALPVAAQPQPPGIETVRFRNYSVAQGLPQASITAIAQDRAGFLWFGTQDGLARFDGYEFLVFQHQRDNPASLSNNHVQALVADPDGGLWIATQAGGLDYYDPDSGRFKHYRAEPGTPGTLASDTVSALALGNDARLWIASLGARLQWLDADATQVHDVPLGERDVLAITRVLLPLPDGSVLVGTAQGLWRVAPDVASMQLWGNRVGDPLDVYALVRDVGGAIWVGTGADGLYRFAADGRLERHYRHRDGEPGSLPDDQIRGLHFDAAGSLWIAGNTHGLARLDKGADDFVHFAHVAANPHSIAANRLWCVASDRDGLLLVGSWTNGLSIHDPRTEMFTQIFSIPGDPRTLPAPPATTVYGDGDGTLWAGVIEGGGLVHIDLSRGVIRRYRHDDADPDSLSSDTVQYVTRTRDGSLWVATRGGGLDRLRSDGSGFDHLRHDPDDPTSLASDEVRFVYEDSRGTLWVATKDAGLDERCAGCRGFVHHRRGDSGNIEDIDISRVLETRDGALWVGTRGVGLYRRAPDGGKFQPIGAGAASGLDSNSITAMYQDSRGDLWVGTQGGALNRLPGADPAQRFQTIDKRDGLASDAIGEILEDADGDIWVSTIKGISRIDPRDLSVRNFGAHDGASALGYWVNSGTILADGRLVFGGLDGITIVDPKAVHAPPKPRPVFTALLLHGVRIGPVSKPADGNSGHHGELNLSHDQNDIAMEFSSLEYSAPESTTYAYRLDGYDHDWIETSASRRVASYTGLPPGHYRLRVRARHGEGPWSADVASMEFVVHPAPWASPQAYAAYAAVLLLLAAGIGWRVRADQARRYGAREALRLSEQRLKLALWGSGSEMWDVDLRDGSMHRENRLPNIAASEEAAAQTLRGYQPFVHSDDAKSFDDALREHVAGRSDSFEASYRTLDHEHRWVWLLSRGRVVQRDAGGRALRISGTSSDISALKQAEESLRSLNEKLESHVEQRTAALRKANAELRATLDRLKQAQRHLLETERLASLGGLVAGVAHEINTPLGVGVTAASWLRDEAARLAVAAAEGRVSDRRLRQFSAHASESAELILRNLGRADRLVKSFKQVAVDQTGDDVRGIDLRACIVDIVTALGPSLRRTPHHIAVDCPVGITLRTSPGALAQIITNLVMNSIIHGFESDTPGHITIALTGDGDGVVLDYRDDGVGMSAEVRARVFEPFFTTRRGRGGSGLGMHIVYNLVTQVLKGSIDVESSPGAGAHIRIRFANQRTGG